MSDTEREALAKMIESGIRLEAFPGIIADHILRSDWLAAHDAQVRADERERVAQAIEVSVSYGFGMNYDGTEDPHASAYVEGLGDAARIARAEPTDSEATS